MEITAVSERALRTGSARRVLWIAFALTLIAGLFCWGFGAYVAATWLFIVAAAAVALVLPPAYALVSPLFMGVVGWLVDMLPLVILVGWLAVVLRWMAHLLLERRRPRGGRWVWLPLFLVFWTALGVVAVTADGIKHFVLLLGVQVLISATLLLIVDSLSGPEARAQVVAALLAYVCVLSGGVFLEWVGVPVQALQDSTARLVLESAYGLDAFPNSMGMIKFTRSSRTGLEDLRSTIEAIANRNAGFPAYIAFKPRYHAYQNYNVIRFEGSARRYESVLERHQIHLIFDNVALAPANTVPRMRSFPRNALTYAGACAALFPFALFLVYSEEGRRKWLGRAGVAAALFGAGFSLSRGAWVASLLAVLYLVADGVINRRQKALAALSLVGGLLVLVLVFFAVYRVSPFNARLGAEGSTATRETVYRDTVKNVGGLHYIVGYGTESPRTASGATHVGGRYIPEAGTHSTYLNYFFRTGVPGAIAIMALYLIAFLHARAAAREKTGDDALFATTAAAAVIVVAAHGLLLSLYVEPIYTLVVSCVVGLAMASAAGLRRSVWPWRTTERRG